MYFGSRLTSRLSFWSRLSRSGAIPPCYRQRASCPAFAASFWSRAAPAVSKVDRLAEAGISILVRPGAAPGILVRYSDVSSSRSSLARPAERGCGRRKQSCHSTESVRAWHSDCWWRLRGRALDLRHDRVRVWIDPRTVRQSVADVIGHGRARVHIFQKFIERLFSSGNCSSALSGSGLAAGFV